MQVNWDAVSAVGTWFGGIATFAAVLVALKESSRANKPRVMSAAELRVHGPFNNMLHESVGIVVTNVGACRASIKGVVIRRPGMEPVLIGIDQGYADFQAFRTLEVGEQIERDFRVSYFRMDVPGKRKGRLRGFVRGVIGRPYSMRVVDTSGREFRVKMSDPLQSRLDAAQKA